MSPDAVNIDTPDTDTPNIDASNTDTGTINTPNTDIGNIDAPNSDTLTNDTGNTDEKQTLHIRYVKRWEQLWRENIEYHKNMSLACIISCLLFFFIVPRLTLKCWPVRFDLWVERIEWNMCTVEQEDFVNALVSFINVLRFHCIMLAIILPKTLLDTSLYICSFLYRWGMNQISRQEMGSLVSILIQNQIIDMNATSIAQDMGFIKPSELLWGESLYPFLWIVYML